MVRVEVLVSDWVPSEAEVRSRAVAGPFLILQGSLKPSSGTSAASSWMGRIESSVGRYVCFWH
jgi:hypothetical protein